MAITVHRIPGTLFAGCGCLLLALTACQSPQPQAENWNYQPPKREYPRNPPHASLHLPQQHPQPLVETPNLHEFAGNQPVIGELYRFTPRSSDTIPDIARHYDLGYQEVADANPGVDPWLLREDETLILPAQHILPDAPHTGIVLNLANMRLFYFPQDANGPVWTFPVGIGRDHWETPLGLTKVVEKVVHPDWIPTPSIIKEHLAMNDPLPQVVKSGPDNPLGNYALMLALKNYLIHGTNKPYGVGMQVSHGCIRLYPEDIESLFAMVAPGTAVHIVYQPYLAAWFNERLYIQAYALQEKWESSRAALQNSFRAQLETLAASHHLHLQWPAVQAVLDQADGLPRVIAAGGGVEVAPADKWLEHPWKLRGTFIPGRVREDDWSIRTAGMFDHDTAKKLAEMLNHQGPVIPSYPIYQDGEFRVISGPFDNQAEAEKTARRISQDFEMNAEVVPPAIKPLGGGQ